MKTKKRFLSILLSLMLVLGLMPGMSVMAIADGQYTIYNEIPSSLADVTCVPSANKEDNVSLTVDTSGKKTVGQYDLQKRDIKLNGITVSKVNGEIVHVDWTKESPTEYTGNFTMPGEAVYISFPFLTDVTVFDISQDTAVFRTKKISVRDTYTFETTDADADGSDPEKDPYGYLYYKESAEDDDYTGIYNDDGGVGYNFKINQLLLADTYCHIGVGYYKQNSEGQIELYSGLLPSVTPKEINLEYGDTSASRTLTVTPNMPDGYTATYQWYENNSQSTSSGSEITGATNSTYSIPQGLVAGSTKYYYCKVQATKEEANPLRAFSNIATVKITSPKAVPATVTANNRTYDGTEKPLVTVDNSTLVGGTMKYALGKDDITKPTEGWSDTIPTGKDAGTYYVWYKAVAADESHSDSKEACVTANIKAVYSLVSVTNGEHTIGDGKDTVLTVKGEPDDNTYENFTGADMDGNAISDSNYTKAKGSLILTLKASYLDTLTTGDHKVTINFKDGAATAILKVNAATPVPTPVPTPTPKPVPKTGDSANPALWLALMLVALIGFAGLAVTGTMKASRKKK